MSDLCALARDRFAAYLDGELSGPEGAELEAHLEACAECRREIDDLAALHRDLGVLTAGPAAARESEIRDILERARGATSRLIALRGSSPSLRYLRSRPRRTWLPAAIAALFLVALALPFATFLKDRPDESDPLAGARTRQARAEVERREAERRQAEERLRAIEEEKFRLQHRLMEQQREEEAERARQRALAEAEEKRRRAVAEVARIEAAERQARQAFERAVLESAVKPQVRVPRPPDQVEPFRRDPGPAAVATGGRLDEARVQGAVHKGVTYLKGRYAAVVGLEGDERLGRSVELSLLTCIHAGVAEGDPEFQKLLRLMMAARLERTYNVALQAMALEELDRVKYQNRILQCAQFLVDNQCRNGQWSYGDPSLFVEDIPTAVGAAGARPPGGGKPKVVRRVPVQKKREGPPAGDNSNSQYAALGLRACHEAGAVLPREVLVRAQKWWRESQHPDRKDPAAGGWCYGGREHGHVPYGSMTAGAVGSLVILDHLLGEDWRRDPAVARGFEWLARNFTAADNPGPPEHGGGRPGWQLYYYLYAVERAGILAGAERFGRHDWYEAGAREVVESQRADGSWLFREGGQNEVADTSFAILFLRKATRALDVPSGKK